MRIYDFKIDGKNNPIGLDNPRPEFSWKLKSDEKDTVQKNYKIIVSENQIEIWKTYSKSENCIGIEYGGAELKPYTEYSAKVIVSDNYGNIEESSLTFETGKLNEKFESCFIGIEESAPIYALKKNITINKSIKKARLYATAHGLYDFYINNEKIDNVYFAPFWTDYHHTLEYQTYDITKLLANGDNELKMLIGKGWYAGAMGFAGETANYEKETAGLALIRIFYEDGSYETYCTDETWRAVTTEVVDSEFYYGETQDFTKKETSLKVVKRNGNGAELIGQINEPVRLIQKVSPISVFKTPKEEYVFDFGQNLVGFVEVEIKESFCGKLRVRHAEVLDKEGNFYTENLRTAISEENYVLSGSETILRPHFTFHGFRYAQIITDHPENVLLTACVIHSDMQRSGTFECSHPKINRLQSNIAWGQKGNFIDVPTDCPQRNERLGWTGDANVFFRTAAFNYDVSLFFSKWFHDITTEQSDDGNVPHVIPNIMGKQDGAALWSDVATMAPWNDYLVYGKKQLLRNQLWSMKKWVDYVSARCGENGLWQSGFQYGDWLALDSGNTESRTGATDKYFIANVLYYVSTKIVADSSKILSEIPMYEEYYARQEQILRAIRREYFTATGRMVTETQTACTLALYYNIVPKKFRQRVIEALKNNLAENKNHLNTGFAGTPFLLLALSDCGEHDLASKILFNEDYPSWLYAVNKGATTIWERWNGILPDGELYNPSMNSFNHYSYGSVGDFLYRKVAGLNIGEAGYKKIIISPNPTPNIEKAKVEYESAYGKIVSGYECKDGKMKIFAEIPANTTAVIILPEKNEKIKVGSGKYEYEYDTKTSLIPHRFTMENTFGSLIEFQECKDFLEKISPGILSGPMLSFANSMTLSELCAYSGEEGMKLFGAVLDYMNGLDKEGKI